MTRYKKLHARTSPHQGVGLTDGVLWSSPIPSGLKHSETGQASNLSWGVVGRDLHVQSAAGVAQVLGDQHGALLTNEQSDTISVAAEIVGADGQISNLEAFDSVNVETLVKDTMLDNGVALFGRHRACAKGVPGGLAVPLDPLLDAQEVLLALLEVLADVMHVRIQHIGFWSFAGSHRHGPRP